MSAANELGYRPNASARLLRQGRTRLIGVMFVMRNPFEVSFVSRLAERAAAENFGLVLGPRNGARQTDQVLSDLLSQRVEAIVAFNPDPAAPTLSDALDLLPVVWMGEHSDEPRADNVHVDDAAGLRLAVQHLKSLGHDRISYRDRQHYSQRLL
jgi:DNA-binding LacI/PurR family transcriptional regulator